MKTKFYIGTSGWHYGHWKNIFYPKSLKKANWLEFYSKFFNAVEINKTFYSTPGRNEINTWEKLSPKQFIFAIKMNKYITHIKKLKTDSDYLKAFLNIVKGLKNKRGPILIQLPPFLKFNYDRLLYFAKSLPKGFKYAIEFRNNGWFCEEVYKILKKYNICMCIHDYPNINCPKKITSNFAYIRFHGYKKLYGGIYPEKELITWKDFFKSSNLKSIYVFFNNDEKAYAVKNALYLKEILE